jgi:hypothetical protein
VGASGGGAEGTAVVHGDDVSIKLQQGEYVILNRDQQRKLMAALRQWMRNLAELDEVETPLHPRARDWWTGE